MNNLITNPIKQTKEKSSIVSKISNIISAIRFISEKDRTYSLSDHIFYLLEASKNSDAKTKSKIENHLVKLGEEAVPCLIKSLTETTGSARGLVAMALIRIGSPSISYLEQIAVNNPKLQWASEYITEEINGTQIKLNNQLEEALVG